MKLSPEEWGPHYWFVIHTIAYTYPEFPNAITKRKYYDFVQNLPLFIPNSEIGDKFSQMLDKYPVSPYLDCKDSFMRWTHFMHNKINALLGKEQVSLYAALDQYHANYLPKSVSLSQTFHTKKTVIHLGVILVCILCIYIIYE
jgi:hypothetical protein